MHLKTPRDAVHLRSFCRKEKESAQYISGHFSEKRKCLRMPKYSEYLVRRWQHLRKEGFERSSFVTGYEITPDSILEEIEDSHCSCDGTSRERSSDLKARKDLLKLQYTSEVWIAELGAADNDHTRTVCADVVDEKWEHVQEGMQPEYSEYMAKRVTQKLRNLTDVLDNEFFETNRTQPCPQLSIDRLKELHKKLMKDLLDKPGEFRTRHARPSSQPSTQYLQPSRIPARLTTLLSFVNDQVGSLREQYEANNKSERTEKAKMFILLGALYFSEFLFIHPFPNGNGRTARISLNLLLTDVCEVPFSLFVCPPLCDESARSLYLKTLSMVHECMTAGQQSVLPTALATYILLCIQRHCGMMRYELVSEE
eukprot:scpid82292/ scgid29856/ 